MYGIIFFGGMRQMEETLKLILEKLNSMDLDIKDLKSDVSSLKKHVLIIEDKQNEDSKALYDGYSQTLENIIEIKKDIKDIKETLNDHEIRLLNIT
jgi:archaellum component FlaC